MLKQPFGCWGQPGSWIKRAACEIVSAAVARGHLDATPATQQELAGNNAAAREAAASLASCVLRDSEAPVCVGGPMTRRATLVRTFLVPAGARAQLGDIRQLAAFLTGEWASAWTPLNSASAKLNIYMYTLRGTVRANKRSSFLLEIERLSAKLRRQVLICGAVYTPM